MDTNRIHELIEELEKETRKAFPDYTSVSIFCETDGYMNVSVTKWDNNDEIPAEHKKRRELFYQHKTRVTDWGVDTSRDQNKYYERIGLLLEE